MFQLLEDFEFYSNKWETRDALPFSVFDTTFEHTAEEEDWELTLVL